MNPPVSQELVALRRTFHDAYGRTANGVMSALLLEQFKVDAHKLGYTPRHYDYLEARGRTVFDPRYLVAGVFKKPDGTAVRTPDLGALSVLFGASEVAGYIAMREFDVPLRISDQFLRERLVHVEVLDTYTGQKAIGTLDGWKVEKAA